MNNPGAHRRTRVRLAVIGTGVVVASLAVFSHSSVATDSVLRLRDVGLIVAHDYSINNRANASLSYALQATNEEGSALAMDNMAFRAARLSGYTTIEGSHYFPFYGRVISSAVPLQSSYPVNFAVLVAQSSSAGTPPADRVCPKSGAFLVLRKVSAMSTWRVAFEPAVARLAGINRFATTGSGYRVPVVPGSLTAPLDSLPQTFVTALNAEATSGAASTLLPTRVFSYGHCGDLGLENPRSDEGTVHGLSTSFRAFAPSPSDLVAFATNRGAALALFTIKERVTEVAASKSQFIIWSHGSTTWWSLLKAGNYTKVSWIIDQELAVVVPSAASGQAVRIVGADSGVIAVSGSARH